MSHEIAAAWSRFIAVREVELDRFIDILFAYAVRTGRVEGRLHGTTDVEFKVGRDSAWASDRFARGRFRCLCARLSVIFGEAAGESPPLYGGRCAAWMRFDGEWFRAELRMNNQGSEIWFDSRWVKIAAVP